MTKEEYQQLVRLLSRAACNKAFRDRFMKSPQSTAGTLKVDLGRASPKEIRAFKTALKRFGRTKNLRPVDAKMWVVGLLHHTQNHDPTT